MPRPRSIAVCALLTALSLLPPAAADWPQFRGPDRHGTVDASRLLEAWSEGQPAELWRRPIGRGFSAVTAVGDRLLTVAVEGDEEVLLALSAADGLVLWRRSLGATGEAFPEGGPRSTPTVSGDVAFVASSQGRLAAVRVEDGEVVWARELAETGPIPRFGYSVSPLVDGELVIVEAGGPESPGVLALDRATGETVWGALDGPAGYSSPIAVEIAGVRQYVFFRRAGGEVVSLSTDGEVLWRHAAEGALAIIVSPVFLPPDRFFVATSDDTFGGLMLRVGRDDDGTFSTEEAWSERLMRNHFSTSVVVGDHLYGFDNATLRCLDAATGERKWARRGLGKGSLVAAGELLFVLGDDGTLVLVEAAPDAYRELGRIRASEGRAWTAPALADGRLYLRDGDEIVSLDVSGAAAGGGAEGATADRRAAGESSSAPVAASGADRATAAIPAPADRSLDEIVACYLDARGGADRWRQLQALEATGSYAAFSESSPMRLLRRRGDLYRLEFRMLGGDAIRARDEEGTWGLHPLLQPVAGRIEEGPYRAQSERESLFLPPLVDAAERGIAVETAGRGEIDGETTVDLRLTFPNGEEETWHLDPATCLEVAVDATVMDMTQLPQPMRQRSYLRDFREVDGLVVPHSVDLEFGARLEEMRIERLVVDPELAPEAFAPPEAPAAPDADGTPDEASGA